MKNNGLLYTAMTCRAAHGPERPEDLPGGRARAQFLARRSQGAPDAAGSEPGRTAPRNRAGRAAVRPIVEEWHADRGGPDAPELRAAPRAARRGDRVGGARPPRFAARPRADRRQRGGGTYAAAADRPLPPALRRHRDRCPSRAGAADRG